MPYYEYRCECHGEPHIFNVKLAMAEVKEEIACPCGEGTAHRVYHAPAKQSGLTALEKRAGTTKKRVEFAKHAQEQRAIRKKEYPPDSREARSNELWTGNEGRDGVTELTVPDHVKRVSSAHKQV